METMNTRQESSQARLSGEKSQLKLVLWKHIAVCGRNTSELFPSSETSYYEKNTRSLLISNGQKDTAEKF